MNLHDILVRAFGVVGGGAVLAFAAATAGIGPLAAAAGLGGLGVVGENSGCYL